MTDFQTVIRNINTFKNTLKGDPTEQLNNLLKSGNVPQGVLDKAQSMAKPIYDLMKSL